MAGKAKSVYLTVSDKETHKTVFSKVFFDTGGYNLFVKCQDFLSKYPVEKFQYIREIY